MLNRLVAKVFGPITAVWFLALALTVAGIAVLARMEHRYDGAKFPDLPPPGHHWTGPEGSSPQDLAEARRGLLHRARMSKHHRISREELSVREHMSTVLRTLKERRVMEFAELFEPKLGIPMLVVTFLAVLELTKETLLDVTQAEPFVELTTRVQTRDRAVDWARRTTPDVLAWYTFTDRNVRFFAIDSNALDERQMNWLRSALAAATDDGRHSRIVPRISAGPPSSVSRARLST